MPMQPLVANQLNINTAFIQQTHKLIDVILRLKCNLEPISLGSQTITTIKFAKKHYTHQHRHTPTHTL